jgi:hypothetical protein
MMAGSGREKKWLNILFLEKPVDGSSNLPGATTLESGFHFIQNRLILGRGFLFFWENRLFFRQSY